MIISMTGSCLGEFFAFQYLSICDLLYLAEISHRKKIVLCLESGPACYTMWKLLPPPPSPAGKKLWQLFRYFSKICPKMKINGLIGQSSIVMPLLKGPLLTVQRLVFKLVRFYLCRNNKRRKVDFPIQEKFSSLGDDSLVPLLVQKKEFDVKRFSYCFLCWN